MVREWELLLFYINSQLTWGLGLISHWNALGTLKNALSYETSGSTSTPFTTFFLISRVATILAITSHNPESMR